MTIYSIFFILVTNYNTLVPWMSTNNGLCKTKYLVLSTKQSATCFYQIEVSFILA